MSGKRTIVWLIAATNAIVLLASLAIGIWMTNQHETLVFDFQAAQAQRDAELAVEDLLWRSHFGTVSRIAAEIAGETDLRTAFQTKDKAALDKVLAGMHQRGSVTSGEVALMGATLFDAAGKPIAEIWPDRKPAPLPGKIQAAIAARSGSDRLQAIQFAWQHDDRPHMTVVAPVGGLRLMGYVALHVDPLPALGSMDKRLGMAVTIKGLSRGETLVRLLGFAIPAGARTVSAQLTMKGPDQGVLARLELVEDVTALTGDLLTTRLTSFVIFLVVMGVLSVASITVTWMYVRASERREMEAEDRLQEARRAEEDARRERERAAQAAMLERREAMLHLATTFEGQVKGLVEAVATAAVQVEAAARTVAESSEQTQRRSTSAVGAADEASANVSMVAGATEELSSSIREIGRQVAVSSEATGAAVQEAGNANHMVGELSSAVQTIGDVVTLIHGIANQTNLLALNATIEAARAGELGKGFAVVASEVKSLANQTAKATEEIQAKVAEVQGSVGAAVQAIQGIGSTIRHINGIATTIASAVEQQGAATRQIAGNVQQAASGTLDVSRNIAGVVAAAGDAGSASQLLLKAAHSLSNDADSMRSEVTAFLERMKAA